MIRIKKYVFDEMVRGLEDSSLFYRIENSLYSGGVSTRIAKAIFAKFNGTLNF